MGFSLNEAAGLYLPASEKFHWWQYITLYVPSWQLFTYFSQHVCFLMFGVDSGNPGGPKRFLIYFLVTGLGAALIHTLIGYYELGSLQEKARHSWAAPGADALMFL
ncbi:MAG: hypothetical protein R2847_09550 [Bacteroidia bacterium]